ncbi:MAG: ankyrin repeat domain-containing protein [Thaumarchaeota archaeon]|nr:ankyrin repeat domain-containing protein [Nitrososphaerota archaeon]
MNEKEKIPELPETGIKTAIFTELTSAANMRGTGIMKKLLVELTANYSPTEIREILNSKDIFGSTLLHTAAWLSLHELTKLLIENGADVSNLDIRGRTPLHFAAHLRNSLVALVLIKNGADVNVTDVDGFTPLYHAVSRGIPETVSLLLANGADPNARVGLGKFSLLDIAVMGRHNQIAELLSRQIALNKKLFNSVAKDNLEEVRLSLETGAQPNATDEDGNSPMHIAVKINASVATVEFLLKRGAYPNTPNKEGLTPYQLACSNGSISQMSLMQQHGAGVYKSIRDFRLSRVSKTNGKTTPQESPGGNSSTTTAGLHNYRLAFSDNTGFGRRGSREHLRHEQRKMPGRSVA